jgi:hypothetical protein
MRRTQWILAVAVLLAVGCDKGEPEDEEVGDESSEGDGDGDGDAPASCLEYQDAAGCMAVEGCEWNTATRITDEACGAETHEMCIPGPTDGGDPACLSAISGCPEVVEGGTGPYQPAYIDHPDGGWVVIDLCGNLTYGDFTACTSALDGAPPACQCACAM